jgi:hypothetical protein
MKVKTQVYIFEKQKLLTKKIILLNNIIEVDCDFQTLGIY